MTKYMLKQPGYVGDSIAMPGEVFEIKKLKHSIQFKNKDEKFKYIVVGEDELLTTMSLKERFTKGTYKSETPKRLLYIISLLTVYELSKYVTNEILIKLSANDEIDTPCDYDKDVK
ncbi:transcriptional activator RinB [Staphylococcus saprophyticus]|uniref:transcriptional activator RinB n=1 Tax=Staphylococcus saprophyticus TaxID=29385 RepID=UPI0010118FA3|nr:hypothetical protein [Staphylococcus saprophyticus]MDW3879869.1 hypothetical protein [Staphylococcus saprophyticus]MDW3959231.1 hypothetical protein [Staphylococcus saprophyticus]MDW4066493.1 hypothetical protein [Staphylococcus saprophyticus]RXR97252.1 hypothetical protein EUA48_06210 [Staphylococcus saprophyticus]